MNRFSGLLVILIVGFTAAALAGKLTGHIVDATTQKLIPARIYILSENGTWHFPKTLSKDGTAIEYRKQRQVGSLEMHTTLSAHPFQVDLPPGTYTITVERGKEYFTYTRKIDVAQTDQKVTIALRRWINMSKTGWYSGDTHVHRSIAELPNLLMAEDLNVALPLTYWVTKSDIAPTQGDKTIGTALGPSPIHVDPTHVIYPINTEYEIFTVKQKPGARHTLGAIFVLGHRTPFTMGTPPVEPIAQKAREQGALLDLDKHSWPWSMMLVPIMDVDLFELSNNHVWRTRFGFRRWTVEQLPKWMDLETDKDGFTEWGWIDFGFQSYYALLNCGFRLRPSAGTASGVHPVPLGFGRVYCQIPDGFSYAKWMQALNQGRSFVTTGPMLDVSVNGQPMGSTIHVKKGGSGDLNIAATVHSPSPIDRIEIVLDGEVFKIPGTSRRLPDGSYRQSTTVAVKADRSTWIAVRAFERRPDGRVRFAHSSPIHVNVDGAPLKPRREEVQWLIGLMQQEITRHSPVLTKKAVDEYRFALDKYKAIERQGLAVSHHGSVRQIIAHRGSSVDRPECTHASTEQAILSGATAVEVDVRTTKDKHLVILHDSTVDRTTNGTGRINDLTLEQTLKLDAGSWFHPQFATEKIPTLNDVLKQCKGRIDILLDLKESGPAFDQAVVDAVKKLGEPDRTIVGVRSLEQARRFRKLLPTAKQIGLIGSPKEIEAYAEAGVETIRLWPRWLDDLTLVERVRKTGAMLHLNGSTGRPDEVKALLQHSPNSLSSDAPAELVSTLRKMNRRHIRFRE